MPKQNKKLSKKVKRDYCPEIDEKDFWVKQARIGHLASPPNDPQFAKDAERIAKKLGDHLTIKYVAKKIADELKAWTKGAQHENLWEDIVDQVRMGYYITWDFYEDIVDSVIEDKAKEWSNYDIDCLWKDSEAKFDWEEDEAPGRADMIDGISREIKGNVFQLAGDEEWPKD